MISSDLKMLVDEKGWRLGLREFMQAHLEPDEAVLAAWEGGSAAFGRADDLSDLDLQLIVKEDQVEAVVARIEELLAEHLPVSLRYEIPQPAWHGMWQAFYQFSAAPPTFMLDMCIAKEGQELTLTEVERHGEPIILFDPQNLIPQTQLDWPKHQEKMRAALQAVSARLPMFHPLVDKEAQRGRFSDALWFHQRMLVPDVITLLRLKHCPERFDYGGRYLDRDLPQNEHEWVTQLMSPGTVEELKTIAVVGAARALQLIKELTAQDWAKDA